MVLKNQKLSELETVHTALSDTGLMYYVKNGVSGTTPTSVVREDNSPDAIFPEHYGTYVDSGTDFSAAILAAVTAANGRKVSFNSSRIYAIDGNLDVGSVAFLSGGTFHQLSPGVTNRRTITSNNATSFRIENAKFLRGGDGTFTDTGTSNVPSIGDADHAIYIACDTGGGSVCVEHCEITGDGFGRAIFVANATAGHVKNNDIHDMNAGSATYEKISDDALEGIATQGCKDFEVSGNNVRDLTTMDTGRAADTGNKLNKNTRAITVSGACESVPILKNKIRNVGQGIDVTGDGNPQHISAIGNVLKNILANGIKFANSAQNCICSDNNLDRVGIRAISVSPPGSDLTGSTVPLSATTGNLLISDNIITNAGINNDGRDPTLTAGIAVIAGDAAYAGYPRGLVIQGNHIIGNANGSMKYGIHNQVTYGGLPFNRAMGNTILNANTADVGPVAFPLPIVKSERTTTQLIPYNAWTAIKFNSNNEDPLLMHVVADTGGVAAHQVVDPGRYNARSAVRFAANATGVRWARMVDTGGEIAGTFLLNDVVAANQKSFETEFNVLDLKAGAQISVEVYQNGDTGGLNIEASETTFTMWKNETAAW